MSAASPRLHVERTGATVTHRYYCGPCGPADAVTLKSAPAGVKRCQSCRKNVGKAAR